MTRREIVLAALVASLVLLGAVRIGVRRVQSSTLDRTQRLAGLQTELNNRRADLERREAAAERLAQWQRRSLPGDRDKAGSLYNKWLQDILVASQLSDVNVNNANTPSRRGAMDALAFRVTCRGTLEQLTQFLYAFYRANHLHKLTALTVRSGEEQGPLDLVLGVEAIILPGAPKADRLSQEPSNRLANDDVSDYAKHIAGRNVFARFSESVAAQESRGPGPGQELASNQLAQQIVVNGIYDDGNVTQVSLDLRNSGQTIWLRPGQPFQVEYLRGIVRSIHTRPREVVLTIGDRDWRVALGQNLSQAIQVGDDEG
jgi:hypothetical protein